MEVLGVKFTRDAAICHIVDGKVSFHMEYEKLAERPRYAQMQPWGELWKFLDNVNIDRRRPACAVDGWKSGNANVVRVAPYHEYDGSDVYLKPLHRMYAYGGEFPYVSCSHVAGHVIGSYMTSPHNKEVYVCTWDGGQNPRVHLVNPANGGVTFIGSVHWLYGIIYGIMGYYWGPYAREDIATAEITQLVNAYGGYDKPGKLMSYMSKGKLNSAMLEMLRTEYTRMEPKLRAQGLGYHQNGYAEHTLCRAVAGLAEVAGASDADALNTMHTFLGKLLLNGLKSLIPPGSPLIFTGGSALNINWNSLLRDSGHFDSVWVPPFPNDAGSALGAACCYLWSLGHREIEWDLYTGTDMQMSRPLPGLSQRAQDAVQVGNRLHEYSGEPIVSLVGRAEAGPRALGHRSILCAPVPGAQQRLNLIKKREDFRPVAPMVLERVSGDWFTPGGKDPYMIFNHRATEQCQRLAPAVVHVDGTSRMQTVSNDTCPIMTQVLNAYYAESGVPVLCNTSANRNGKGFFDSMHSAMEWAEHNHVYQIWDGSTLFIHERFNQ